MTEHENTRAEGTLAPTDSPDSAAAPTLDVNPPATGQEAGAPSSAGPRFTQAVRDWLVAGARVLTFRTPQWSRLRVHPLAMVAVLALTYLLAMGAQRALISGPANFVPRAWLAGWATEALVLWLCWVVSRSASGRDAPPASPALLFMALLVSEVMFSAATSALLLSVHQWVTPWPEWPSPVSWTFYIGMIAWLGLAHLRMLLGAAGTVLARGAVLVLLPLSLWISHHLQPVVFWWEPYDKSESTYQGVSLDDEVVFGQPELLARTLEAVQAPRPGQVNLYSITYAPYASQDVFMKESRVVTETMDKRFGAQGHSVELVLNPATGTTLPWAVPLALRKSIQRMAAVMDRDRDVLFLHLTSHGARSGELAVNAWPLESEPVTPDLLKLWLDEAGIRWRVISISACYSGSWIDALVSEETLVMTAADADHTSYGCGSRSELTFFGRALYVDALAKTWSFEEAHAQARQLIETREKEAGKTDGYSNPQLRMGTAIRPVLERLAAQQAAMAKE